MVCTLLGRVSSISLRVCNHRCPRCVSSAPPEVNSCLADGQEMARRRTRRMPSCHFFTYRRSHDCGWLVLVLATRPCPQPQDCSLCQTSALQVGGQRCLEPYLLTRNCILVLRTLSVVSGMPFCKSLGYPSRSVTAGSEDLVKVAWRGRWARQKTVEFYLQEVAAQIVLQRLPLASRSLISDLRPFAAKLVSFYSSHPRSN